LAATCKTTGLVSAIGTSLMLIFGILSGSFTNVSSMPEWVQTLSYVSPNRWGLDGFNTLAMGGTLPDILMPIVALLIMAAGLFLISILFFTRRGIGKQ
jgi:ABC-type multidrug transport system permease subunit